MDPRGRARRLNPNSLGVVLGYAPPLAWARRPVQVPSPQDRHPSGPSCVNTALHPQKQALRRRRRARKAVAYLRPGALRRRARPCPALVAFASGGRRGPVGVRTRWRGGSGWLARGERIEPWPINEPNCFRSGMPQPHDPARTPSAPRQTKKTADPARRPRPPQGPVAAREWDVAHAAALRALLTQPPAVLPNQVGPVTAKVCVLARALRNTRFVKSAAPDPQQNQALRPSFPRAPGSEVSRDTTVVRSTVRPQQHTSC